MALSLAEFRGSPSSTAAGRRGEEEARDTAPSGLRRMRTGACKGRVSRGVSPPLLPLTQPKKNQGNSR